MPFLHLVLNLYLRTKLADEYATAVSKSIHCLQFDRGYSYIAVRRGRKRSRNRGSYSQYGFMVGWSVGRNAAVENNKPRSRAK